MPMPLFPHRLFGTASARGAIARALATGAAVCTIAAAHAQVVHRHSGPTHPELADFHPTWLSYPVRAAGYGDPHANRMFMETLRLPCAPGTQPQTAQLRLELTKLGQGPSSGDNDTLVLAHRGQVFYSAFLWRPSDPAGAQRSLVLNLAALPPGPNRTGQVMPDGTTRSPPRGAGMVLLEQMRLSFLVQDDTAVRSAELHYSCGAGAPNSTASPPSAPVDCRPMQVLVCTHRATTPWPGIGPPWAQLANGVSTAAVRVIGAERASAAQLQAICKSRFGAGFEAQGLTHAEVHPTHIAVPVLHLGPSGEMRWFQLNPAQANRCRG